MDGFHEIITAFRAVDIPVICYDYELEDPSGLKDGVNFSQASRIEFLLSIDEKNPKIPEKWLNEKSAKTVPRKQIKAWQISMFGSVKNRCIAMNYYATDILGHMLLPTEMEGVFLPTAPTEEKKKQQRRTKKPVKKELPGQNYIILVGQAHTVPENCGGDESKTFQALLGDLWKEPDVVDTTEWVKASTKSINLADGVQSREGTNRSQKRSADEIRRGIFRIEKQQKELEKKKANLEDELEGINKVFWA